MVDDGSKGATARANSCQAGEDIRPQRYESRQGGTVTREVDCKGEETRTA